jgi:RNA polymerase sigma factor
MLEASQAGDDLAREKFIKKYMPFVYKVASKVSGQYIDPSTEEGSISLIAFNEAIDNYDLTKGANFLSFAELVIKRRLIDYYRKEQKNNAVPISSLITKDEEINELESFEINEAARRYQMEDEARERRQEIIQYQDKLKQFGISMQELVHISPKHEDARVRAMEAAWLIAGDQMLRHYLLAKKELPLKFLEARVGVSRKTLERQRKYIIALTIILINDFPYLKEYIKELAGRGEPSV